jgi:predicted ATP-grasp superfamily ATP-dependent carboligase
MHKVLVLDAQMRSSLAVIRSLGKEGLDVTAGEETRFATGLFSKYCRHKIIYPSPKKDCDNFIKCLCKVLKSENYDVLFPVADACLKPIIDNQLEISQYTKIALPSRNIFLKAYDKGETLKIAIDNNIPCPKTLLIDNMDMLNDLTDKLSFPLLIKPRVSSGRRGIEICTSYKELKDKTELLLKEYGGLLFQEYIPYGGEFGVYTLLNYASEPRALSVQKRIRSYPIAGGPSTLRETFKDDTSTNAVEVAFKLLKAMGWIGAAMVEFRIDARDGTPKLMEVNPRFWGSLQLSILAGMDFPYMLYRMYMDGDVQPAFDYRESVKCRWLLPGDILWFLSAPKSLQTLKEFLTFNMPDDIISINDFGPTVGFVLATGRHLFDKEMWKFVLRR